MSDRTILIDGEPVAVTVARRGTIVEARVGDETTALTVHRTDTSWRVTLADRTLTATVIRERDVVWVAVAGEVHRCTASDEARGGGTTSGVRLPRVTAPMPGKVLAVRVVIGQTLAAGDPLVVLEAMKMETIVSAESAARVVQVHVEAGAMVEQGQTLVELEFA
jgi:acetyl/propionyl-CoA carboxylase alpha subunit